MLLLKALAAFLIMLTAFSTLAAPAVSAPSVATLATDGLSTVSYGGYMNGESFQQEGITSYNGWQYAAYWNSAKHAVIARRQLPSGSWQKVVLSDYTTTVNDAHNVISIGISAGDGTLHLAFDMHASILRYRKSVTGLVSSPASHPWNTAQFGAVQSQLSGSTLSTVTYPYFIMVPGGKLQLSFRNGSSGSGDQVLYEYSSGTWTNIGKFIDGISSSVNAYLFGIEYGASGRLHTTWTWRDTPDASTNHDIMYAYSDDKGRTWKNNSGAVVAKSGSTYITPSSPCLVWKIATNRGLINQESQVVDSNGVVHVIASHLPDNVASTSNFTTARASAHIQHYFRSTSGTWTRQETAFLERGSRSDVGVDSKNNLYIISGDSTTFKLHVETASAASNWTDWTLRYTSGPTYFSDALLDHARILKENKLSVVNPRVSSGTIDVLDFSVTP